MAGPSAAISSGSEIRHPGAGDYGLLILLSLVWGSSFLAIKIAVDHAMPPMTLAALRIGLGAAVLLTIAKMRGQSFPALGNASGLRIWMRILLLGIVGNALPFFLIAWGEQTTTSQLAGILMATIPMMVVILAHFLTHDERLSAAKLAGVTLGFLGVAVLIGVDALRGLGQQVNGQLLIVAGCVSYSVYGVNARKLPRLPAEMLIGSTLLAGFLALLPFWLIHDRPWEIGWNPRAVTAVVWLGLLSTGSGNLLYYLILRKVGVGFASFNNYLAPMIALAYGYLWLGETPHLNALAALLLILAGLALARPGPARPGLARPGAIRRR
jgi:drug/metabolite transporter (DMT)-like permease